AWLDRKTGRAALAADAPHGYLTAYDAEQPNLARPVEMWPRLLRRPDELAAVQLFAEPGLSHESVSVRKLLDARALLRGTALAPSFARAQLTTASDQTLEQWLHALPKRASQTAPAQTLAADLRAAIGATPARPPEPLTFARTAHRDFEVAYWETIRALAEGRYVTKNNADCVLDGPTQAHLAHH